MINLRRSAVFPLAALALLVGLDHPAKAGAINITVNPTNVGLSGAGNTVVGDFTIADYAIVEINNSTGAFTEVANFNTTAFDGNSAAINTPGTYQLFGTLVATGSSTFNPVTGIQVGTVSTLSATIRGQTSNTATFTLPTTFAPSSLADFGIGSAGGQKLLGTVALDPTIGTSIFAAVFVPTASFAATGKVTPDGTNGSFWVSPDLTKSSLDAFVSASVSSNIMSVFSGALCPVGDTCFEIGTPTKAGGGDITFDTIPEPSTIAIIGMGLLGLGIWGRRRNGTV